MSFGKFKIFEYFKKNLSSLHFTCMIIKFSLALGSIQVQFLEEQRIDLMYPYLPTFTSIPHFKFIAWIYNKVLLHLQLQENILSLEEEMREQNSRLRQATDAIKAEEEMQSKLSSRLL